MNEISPEQLTHLYDRAVTALLTYAPKFVLALVVLLVGWWLIRRVVNLLEAALQRSSADVILAKFLKSLAGILLKALLLISVASMVGIATTSFIAILGAAGLAIGLALQGSLSNFAGGVLILLFRPFKVGDFIEAQGVSGTVYEMQIFNTILKTPDNKRVIVPNGRLANENIINYSSEATRRVDLLVGVSYDEDLSRVKTIVEELLRADDRVLTDPAPLVAVAELADSSVNLTIRAWVASADFWPYKFALTESLKVAFDAADVAIPYPQQDVHLYGLAGKS